jgi:hypothetical protein
MRINDQLKANNALLGMVEVGNNVSLYVISDKTFKIEPIKSGALKLTDQFVVVIEGKKGEILAYVSSQLEEQLRAKGQKLNFEGQMLDVKTLSEEEYEQLVKIGSVVIDTLQIQPVQKEASASKSASSAVAVSQTKEEAPISSRIVMPATVQTAWKNFITKIQQRIQQNFRENQEEIKEAKEADEKADRVKKRAIDKEIEKKEIQNFQAKHDLGNKEDESAYLPPKNIL